MSDNVELLADVKNDNRLVDPVTMLRDLANKIEAGDVDKPTGAIVILVEIDDERFNWRSFYSKIKTSQVQVVCACLAHACIDDLNKR